MRQMKALVGLLTVLVAALLGSFILTVFTAPTGYAVPNSGPAPMVGRYQLLVPNDGAVGRAMLLDTVTGQTWHRVQYTNLKGEPDIWELTAPRAANDAELQQWIARHEYKSPESKP